MSEEDMNAWLIDTDLAHAPSDGSTGVVAGDDRPFVHRSTNLELQTIQGGCGWCSP